MTGWIALIIEIKMVIGIALGAFSAITGKLKKLTAVVLIFEIISYIGSVICAVINVRSNSDSWSETWKYFRESLSKPFGPQDYSEYETVIDALDAKFTALEEENKELREHNLLLHGLKKPSTSRKKTTKKKEEDLNKAFDV